MNVASQKLCKELYELSGWGLDELSTSTGMVIELTPDNVLWADGVPQYDLGYLVRRIPLYEQRKYSDSYGFLDLSGRGVKEVTADSPEDAACRLAIELFKKGILR